jgi:hypothetical protein
MGTPEKLLWRAGPKELSSFSRKVLLEASINVGADSGIETTILASDDVYPVVLHVLRTFSIIWVVLVTYSISSSGFFLKIFFDNLAAAQVPKHECRQRSGELAVGAIGSMSFVTTRLSLVAARHPSGSTLCPRG